MFKLLRYYSLSSLLVIALASAVLGWVYREIARNDFMIMQERNHVILTEALEQTLWQKFVPLLTLTDATAKAASGSAELQELDASVRKLIRQTGVVKVKVYNPQGVTVYSSDPKQIGESKRDNPGFVRALAGKPASELTHRDKFSAFEGELVDRDLLSSYVSVYSSNDEHVSGVFELYSDVTKELAHISREQANVSLIVLAILAILYGVLVLIVLRAHRIMQTQHNALQSERSELQEHVKLGTAKLEAKDMELQQEAEQRKAAEKSAQYLANHDWLTELPNRHWMDEHMALELMHAQPLMALVFIDIDNLRTINDALGYHLGDELLRVVAQRLRYGLSPHDALARWGGDEFVILMPQTSDVPSASSATEALLQLIAEPVQIAGQRLTITASAGISFYDLHGTTAEALYQCADIAMFQAKALGRQRVCVYQPDMQNKVKRRLLTERMLQSALEEQRFELHYQPQIDMASGEILGIEALIRLNDPELGQVSPMEFIPLAEENGKIIPIGEWALREACRMSCRLHAAGHGWVRVAVNLSPRQFHSERRIEELLANILKETGCKPEALAVEITENVMIDTTGAVAEALHAISRLGVEIAIDDFGSGYSNFRYLRELPIHKLKIDKTFTKDLDQTHDASLVTAMVSVARSLKLAVIAEGVETHEQADMLTRLGCSQAQGYLYAKPMSEANLKFWLSEKAGTHGFASPSKSRFATH